MRITKSVCIICLCLATCISCSKAKKYDGYTYNKQYDYYYRLLAFEDSYKSAEIGDFVAATIQFSLVDSDTASFVANYEVQISNEDTLGLPMLLKGAHTGDSLSFIVPMESFAVEAVFPEEFSALAFAEELKLSVLVTSVLDSTAYYLHKKETELWKQTKQDFEEYKISQYMKRHRVKFVHLKNGIYKRILKRGKGKLPKAKNVLTVTYQGSTLEGEIINHFTTLDFVYGSDWQVIKGIEMVLATMKQGERAQIIVPSKYAWGEQGTSNGSIAPYTPLIFDIELKNIKR